MDFSAYIEDQYPDYVASAAAEKKPDNKSAEVSETNIQDLTQQVKEEFFVDWDVEPSLTGYFHGAGPTYRFVEGDKEYLVTTWALKDKSERTRLIPQWACFSQQQGDFAGFQNEEANGPYQYSLSFLGKEKGKYEFAIFKKRI